MSKFVVPFSLLLIFAGSVVSFVLSGENAHDTSLVTGLLSELDHTLIFFGCFLSIILLFRRHLTLVNALSALCCATAFIAAGGHFEVAYLILGENKNPQIFTVALFIVTTVFLLTLCSRKATRTMDRTLIGTACLSMLLTGLLFHYVLIQTALPSWARDAAWANSFLLPESASEFQEMCEQAELECWHGSEDSALDSDSVNPAFRQMIQGIDEFYEDANPEHAVGHGFGAFNDLEPAGVAVVLYYRDGADVRVISDARAGERIHGIIRDAFYLLSSAAHGVWLLGSLFLIWFHRRRFERRRTCS